MNRERQEKSKENTMKFLLLRNLQELTLKLIV
jgi:hypothetical protein